jgi:GNAT superfamily N-acetyltransferase
MNKHLIENEGSRNPMSVDELQQRMRKWLDGEWDVVLFAEQDDVVGYAVYQFRRDAFEPEAVVVYLRQMFIKRDKRSQGLGQRVVKLLMQTRFPPGCIIEIEVLATNPSGARFWQRVGFQPYCTTMKLKNQEIA